MLVCSSFSSALLGWGRQCKGPLALSFLLVRISQEGGLHSFHCPMGVGLLGLRRADRMCACVCVCVNMICVCIMTAHRDTYVYAPSFPMCDLERGVKCERKHTTKHSNVWSYLPPLWTFPPDRFTTTDRQFPRRCPHGTFHFNLDSARLTSAGIQAFPRAEGG